ncbi:alpha-dehydro-beta-deoxy-D-glucarate aldolase [compost metagenome]
MFIGRGDMAVALNDRESGAPVVQEATSKVISAANKAGKTVFLLAATPQEASEFHARGVAAFVISSDQGFLRTAAAHALCAFTDSNSARI